MSTIIIIELLPACVVRIKYVHTSDKFVEITGGSTTKIVNYCWTTIPLFISNHTHQGGTLETQKY